MFKTKLKAREFLSKLMGPFIQVNGFKTSNTGMAKSNLQGVQSMLVSMIMGISRGEGSFKFTMGVFMRVPYNTTCFMVTESSNGQMEENTEGIGFITKCMDRGSICGLMAKNTKGGT